MRPPGAARGTMAGVPRPARLTRRYPDLARPVREFRFVVNLPEDGERLDRLLRAHFPWHSRTWYRDLVRRGGVTVNGRAARPSTRARRGDEVAVALRVDPAQPEVETDAGLVVLYEDEHLVALDKPSGLACHPVGRLRHGTLINKLHARYRAPAPGADVVPRLAHRLDQDTSGVVLAVKHREADRRVTAAFTRREVRKTYLALVRGAPCAPQGEVDAPLGPDPAGETALHQGVRPDGLPARTAYRVRRRFARHAWLELEPRTGRTHQIRVHLAHLGCPIVADHLYGSLRPLHARDERPDLPAAADEVLLGRLGLHAARLELAHPMTGAPLDLQAPLAPDLDRALAALTALAAAPADAGRRA